MALKDKIKELMQEGAFANYTYTPNNNRGSYRGRGKGQGSHHGGRGQQSHNHRLEQIDAKLDQVGTSTVRERGGDAESSTPLQVASLAKVAPS